MLVSQIITVLGLCLSQARAAAVLPVNDEAIKSFVGLVTRTDVPLENAPGFSKIRNSFHKQHALNGQQFHEDFANAVSPMLDLGDEHTPYLLDSFISFRQTLDDPKLADHPAVREERLQIYRNALYSELVRLGEHKTEKFNSESLQRAHKSLHELLNKNPDGEQPSPTEIFEELKHTVENSNTFKPTMTFTKLDRAQVNEQLKKTNVAGAPEVGPLTGHLPMELFTTQFDHMAHHHQLHATAAPAVAVA